MLQRTRSRVVGILVLLAIAGAIARWWPRPTARGADALRAVQRPLATASVRINAWFHAFTRALRDPARVNALEVELAELRQQRAELQRQLFEFTEGRRERAQTSARESDGTTIAHVVAATFEPTSHVLVVSHPDTKRIRMGDPVLARGALIGVVSAPGRTRTTVQLLTDPGTRIGVEPATAAGTIGILEAHAGGGLAVSHIPSEWSVRVGDAVVTDATTSGLPRGIPIGTVSAVAADPDGFFQTAAIDPIADPRRELVVTIRTLREG